MAKKENSADVRIANLPPVTINVKEAAQLMGLGESLMRQLIRRSDFPAFKVQKRIMVSYDGLRKWAMEQAQAAQGVDDV